MRFRRQMHHVGDAVLFHHAHNGSLVTQVHLLEDVLGMLGDCFQIRQNLTYIVRRLRISRTPPVRIEETRVAAATPVLNEVDQQTRMLLDGTLSDRSTINLVQANACATYQTSNSRVATVDRLGTLTARGPGLAFVTAIVEGVTAVTRVLVVPPGVGLTTVTGTVQLEDGTVVSGAAVSVLGQPIGGRTGLDGFFEIAGVAASRDRYPTLTAVAQRRARNRLYVGSSASTDSVPSGITHVGLITLSSVGGDRDGDGIPDGVEAFLRLSVDRVDTDGDGLRDGEEDQDNDGLTNFEEVAAGTILSERSGIAVVGDRVPRGTTTAAIGVFLIHWEFLDAFSAVLEHQGLPVVRYVQSEERAGRQPEFVQTEELSPGKSLLATILDLDSPHDFRTLDVSQATEVFRVEFDVSGAQGTNPVGVLKGPFGPRGIVPEFTVNGRAVAPEEIIDGEVVITEQ